jgi:DNA-3-methyladenine glycosylase II
METAMAELIHSENDLQRGAEALCQKCEVVARLLPDTGLPPLRRDRVGLDGLIWIVIGQQVSVAAGNAIWNKFIAGYPVRDAATLLAAEPAALAACGLSRPKLLTIQAVAKAIVERSLDLDALADMPADDAKAKLTAVKGIGPWTADIYLMFCLGHADAFAPGDLALQEAIRIAFKLDERPTIRETELIAERWRPWRAVAARWLWAYYKVAKTREGVMT